MNFDFAGRIAKLKKLVAQSDADALLLVASEGFDANSYYYSGDETHPTIIIATQNDATIFSLAHEKFGNLFESALALKDSRKKLLEVLKEKKVKALGVDDLSASAGSALRFSTKLKTKLIPLGQKLSEIRMIKEEGELERIKKACEVTLKALRETELQGFAGKTENQLAGILEERARFHGGSLDAFPPMALSGKRTCMFHNTTSNKRIVENEVVLIDCGARYDFYCADYARSYYSSSNKKMREALEVVTAAKDAAARKAKVGMTGKQLDEISLKVIDESGWRNYSHKVAGHGIGHFIGLNVHDGGDFYGTKLKKGMAFTIEPGIYVPGEFGVRVEDTVVLK